MVDISKLREFEELNPWWATGEVPSELIGIKRKEYLDQLKANCEKEEIDLISGIRRAGKTTLLYQLIDYLLKERKVPERNILFANCDDIVLKKTFKNIMEIVSTFNASGEGRKYVFLDEVQYFEDWEQQLKNVFDRFRRNVKLIVSGSSAVLSKSKNLYYLTGRFRPLHVYPFSFSEFLHIKKISMQEGKGWEEVYRKYAPLDPDKYLQEYLIYGGFPQIVLEKNPKEKFATAKLYFETILYKDILKLWEIKDVTALEKIGKFMLQNIGQRFSYRKISNGLQINLRTTQNYIDYLSTSFLVYLVEYYAKTSYVQIKKEKKIFTIDNILHTSYFGYENMGALAENTVFVHLLKKGYRPNYWKNKREVDFVVEENGSPLPIEVKYQESITTDDFAGLHSFFNHFKETKEGWLITKNEFGEERVNDGWVIKLIPLWLFLLE